MTPDVRPAEALAVIRRTEAATQRLLTPDAQLLCLVWAAAWAVATGLFAASSITGWAISLVATGCCFAVAGTVTGVHTARRTGLAVAGSTARLGARQGAATSAAMLAGLVTGAALAGQGAEAADAVRVGLAVAAVGTGCATLAGAAVPPVGRQGMAVVSFGCALAWLLADDPAPGGALLCLALLVTGWRVGRR